MVTLEFDPENLFPLVLDEELISYPNAQRHSELVDQFLGFRCEEIERRLLSDRGAHDPLVQEWIGLPIQAMQTPYTEVRLLLHRLELKPGDQVIDLGAAYGRMAFVLAKHHPGLRWSGFESVQERVEEGNRVLRERGILFSITHQDLVAPAFQLPVAQAYFLYDFGSRDAVQKILRELQEIARSTSITVVGRGRLSRDLIERENPWLSQVTTPQHFKHYSIYRSS